MLNLLALLRLVRHDVRDLIIAQWYSPSDSPLRRLCNLHSHDLHVRFRSAFLRVSRVLTAYQPRRELWQRSTALEGRRVSRTMQHQESSTTVDAQPAVPQPMADRAPRQDWPAQVPEDTAAHLFDVVPRTSSHGAAEPPMIVKPRAAPGRQGGAQVRRGGGHNPRLQRQERRGGHHAEGAPVEAHPHEAEPTEHALHALPLPAPAESWPLEVGAASTGQSVGGDLLEGTDHLQRLAATPAEPRGVGGPQLLLVHEAPGAPGSARQGAPDVAVDTAGDEG